MSSARQLSQTRSFRIYRGVVGGLLFLATHTRPDISFAVSSRSKFLSNPGSAHWIDAKRVLRYLRGAMDITLSYRRGQNSQCDADWSSDVDDRRSTSGYCFFMNELSGAVSWACRKQQTVSLSTAEAKYMAVSAASQEVLFLEQLSREITGDAGRSSFWKTARRAAPWQKNRSSTEELSTWTCVTILSPSWCRKA